MYSVKLIRHNHPRAYERWTDYEDKLLIQKYHLGLDTTELAELLKRQPGAIRSRLRKIIPVVRDRDSSEPGGNTLTVKLHFD